MKKAVILLLIGLVALIPSFCMAQSVKEITLVYEDQESFPDIMGDQAVLETKPGVVIELVRLLEQKMGIKINLQRHPWKKCLDLVKAGEVDGVILGSYNKERGEVLAYPMKGDQVDTSRQITSMTFTFYKRKGEELAWDGKDLANFTGKIGAPTGYSIVGDLKAKGYEVDEAVTVINNLESLVAGWVDIVAELDTQADYILANNPELNAKIEKVSPAIITKPYYNIFSKKLAQQDPEFTAKFWEVLTELTQTQYKTLAAKYY
ncbi:MAG: transporter substrate-binding domain-containing protein [Candidatus Omnitrophica bacterium]|nr:transporter substrate-binding domain-containing protein [Candidatus Omnitrophota bacterium]